MYVCGVSMVIKLLRDETSQRIFKVFFFKNFYIYLPLMQTLANRKTYSLRSVDGRMQFRIENFFSIMET